MIYMVLADIPPQILPSLQFVCTALSRTVYSLPVKWETHGAVVEWGECAVQCPTLDRRWSLMRKGAAHMLQDAAKGECWRWVHPQSPNARVIWCSLLPSLSATSLWYAWPVVDITANLPSLVWGLAIWGYPPAWLKPLFHWCREWYRVSRVFPLSDMHMWLKQGRAVGAGLH